MKARYPAGSSVPSTAALPGCGIDFVGDGAATRTPQEVARGISGLEVPEGSRVVHFEERWNDFNGDGHAHVEIALTPDELRALAAEARREGWVALPVPDRILRTDPGLPREGLYRLRDRPGDSRLVVLDTRGGRLIARVLLS